MVTLPSGSAIQSHQAGTGPKPAATDNVVCNYRGTLIDGTEFDSSYKRGQPATFPVNGVIKGWTEALQLCPSARSGSYGFPPTWPTARPPSPEIGHFIMPNSTLLFDIELLEIKKGDEKGAEASKPAGPAHPIHPAH